MPLPKISTPLYELQLPSNGKKIKYRPFLVREEKVLILALEGGDNKSITNAVKKILKDCISTRGVKIEELPTFDIEYLFLNIRGKSVGEALDLIVTCPDDNETTVPVKVYIDEIGIQINDQHKKDIVLNPNLTLRMKYPSMNEFIANNFEISGQVDQLDQSFDIIASCIDMVYNADESWAASDCTKKELNDWLGSLDSRQFKEIELFFQTMPKLSHTVTVTNPNTQVESDIKIEGLQNFFG